MARLTRLILPGLAHYLVQRGHNAQPVVADEADRQRYVLALQDGAASAQVAVHAYAVLDAEIHLLATPATPDALGRLVQAVGRRYASQYNRRHARTGSLWAGRFGCAAVEPGEFTLNCMRLIDSPDEAVQAEPNAAGLTRTSAAHHSGRQRQGFLVDPPEYWGLGNTPFAREAAYAALLHTGLPPTFREQAQHCAQRGWPLGSAAFLAQLQARTQRAVKPPARGRPRKAAD